MTKLIDDLARAIYSAEGGSHAFLADLEIEPWKSMYVDAASAALSVVLASLREPTTEMIVAGYVSDAFRTPDHFLTDRDFSSGAVWQAMLSQWVKENA